MLYRVSHLFADLTRTEKTGRCPGLKGLPILTDIFHAPHSTALAKLNLASGKQEISPTGPLKAIAFKQWCVLQHKSLGFL